MSQIHLHDLLFNDPGLFQDWKILLKGQGYEQWEIAEALGRSPSTISRELARNSKPSGEHGARYAQMTAKPKLLRQLAKSTLF